MINVGIDIAKFKHVFSIYDTSNGQVIKEGITFTNDLDGFTKLLDHIKRGSEFVENEECAKILFHEEKMAGFYNKLGELVYSRPIMPQEMQKTMFSINRKTGTES